MKKILEYLNIGLLIVLIISYIFGKFGIYIDEKEYYYEYYNYNIDNNYLRLISLLFIFITLFIILIKISILKENKIIYITNYILIIIMVILSILSSIITISKHGFYQPICYFVILINLMLLVLNIYKFLKEKKQ